MLFRALMVIGMLALLGAAFANEPVMVDYSLLPAGGLDWRGTLDDPQPDSIIYDDDNPSAYYPQLNYWIYTRFTAPATFRLVSVYFASLNAIQNAAPCSVYVCTPNGTQPGAVLANWRVDGPLPDFTWNDTNAPDTVEIAANTDFLVILGPVPGGNQATGGFQILLDNANTNQRSRIAFTGGRMGTYQATGGDFFIRVGGLIGDAFYDLTARECYNTTSANQPSFNVEVGEEITLHTIIENTGNRDIPNYVVAWSVEGPGGGVVYEDDVLADAIPRDALATIDAPATFTCNTAGEYFVTCTVANDSDANAENDVTNLRFFAGGNHRWYRYDDNGAPESSVGFSEGNGWGVAYTPTTYPASIESLRVAVGTAGAGDFRIYLNGEDGLPAGVPLWTSTPAVIVGWNSIPVNPPVLVFEGTFTIAYLFQGAVGLGKDDSPPNCAGITNMGVISYQAASDGGEWFVDESGNWCLQAYVDTSSQSPPFPVIRLSQDTLFFGDVDTTGTTNSQVELWIHNDGGQDALNITQMQLTPASIRSAYTIAPATVTVAAQDSELVTLTFNPSAVRAYNGLLAITNNSNNDPDLTILVRGNGIAGTAADDQAGTLPAAYSLEQNYPNPFNPATEIRFELPAASYVKLSVYNLVGQEVRTLVSGNLTAGAHAVTFDAATLPSGLYYYRMEANDFTAIRKMLLMK
ncbi:T9SS type A sorting domain-containing protein [candidate division KSB1 bacterium]|nr:T9SS type A sorting domain-containing protein [candidate division KSB1 bacterium]